MQALGQGWRRLSGDSRLVVAGALLAVLIAAAIVVVLWTSNDRMVPLYGQQENYDTSEIVNVLESEGIAFELDSRTGDVLVPADQVAPARMKLAAQGVTARMPAGMESLQQLSSLSTSQFMENSRYTYAVEGELARSIMTLTSVRSARVHLAIPDRTLFVGRDEQVPTASVIIDLASDLRPDQVESIVNLVAASVTGMKPGSVSVVDQQGNLLSAGIGEDTPGRLSNKQLDYVSRLEKKIADNTGDMLEPLLGTRNFRVRVSADVDFSEVEETREVLADEPVLISETSLLDNAAGQLALGIPGALANQPPVAAEEGEEADQAVNRREEVNRRYDTGRAVTHTRNAEARIRKLNVSVLVNDGVAPEGAWNDQQLERMTTIVQTAAGVDVDRGDVLTLQSAPFRAPEVAPEPEPLPWWQQLTAWEDYLRYLIGTLLMIMILFIGVRPLVRYLTAASRSQTNSGQTVKSHRAAGQESDEQVVEEAVEARLERESQQGTRPAAAIGREQTSQEDDIALSLPPPGSELEVQLEHLRLLADKETNRVAEVIKTWVQDNGRTAS
jgi:flagellar M-ring protein FliF